MDRRRSAERKRAAEDLDAWGVKTTDAHRRKRRFEAGIGDCERGKNREHGEQVAGVPRSNLNATGFRQLGLASCQPSTGGTPVPHAGSGIRRSGIGGIGISHEVGSGWLLAPDRLPKTGGRRQGKFRRKMAAIGCGKRLGKAPGIGY